MFNTILELVGAVTSGSVGVVVSEIVKHTTPSKVSKVTKTAMTIGGMALSATLGALTSEYIKKEFKDIKEDIIKKEVNEEDE